MRISLIVAMDRNALIGTRGQLPWHLPADLKRFRQLTTGHPVIMGRKTWDSLWSQPLKGRTNLVISRMFRWFDSMNDAQTVPSLEAALKYAEIFGNDEAFVIGGAQVFAAFLPIADRIYVTQIEHEFEASLGSPVYFPGGIPGGPEWRVVEQEMGLADQLAYRFAILERRHPIGG